jgi:plastocyanin
MVKRARIQGILGISVAAAIVVSACGGGNGGGNTPTGPSTGGSGQGGQSGATITIGANGAVTPSQVTVNVGQSVTFVNNSNGTPNISSDPHPTHTDCPAFLGVALIAPGQTKQTNAFTAARTCGFHDHDNPDNAAVRGSVIVR